MASKSTVTREMIESILDTKLKPLNTKIDSVVESINFWENKFGDLSKRVNDLEQSSGQVLQENRLLKDEILRLSNNLNMHKESLNNLEQYIRRECLEITGIPEEMHEDTDDIVIKVGSLMGIEIQSNDISVSHRLSKPSYSSVASQGRRSKATSKIIAKFVRRDVQDQFYKARKYLRDKSTRDLGMARHSDNHIYINESLSPKNKELFKECLKLKREMNFKFIWTHYGRIYLRKDANSPAKAVSN